MKKLLLIFLILLIPFTTYAWDYKDSIKGAIMSKKSAITDCCPAADADYLCEDWSGVTDCGNDVGNSQVCQNTYVISGEGDGNLVTFASNVVSIIDANALASGPFFYNKFGNNVTEAYFQFYFKVPIGLSSSSIGIDIAESNNSATMSADTAWKINFFRVAATGCGGNPSYSIRLSHHNGTSLLLDTNDITNLCTDTTYGIRIYYKMSNSNGISWAIDYDMDGTFTNQSVADPQTTTRYASYFRAMSYCSQVAQTPIIKFGRIKIGTSAYPIAETGQLP